MNEFEFDYDFYLEMYKDLRHLTKDQALHHWKMHGENEGRRCKREIVNDKNNITIIIHLFYENLLDEFLKYISEFHFTETTQSRIISGIKHFFKFLIF